MVHGTVDALPPAVSSNILSGQIITNLMTISIDCQDNTASQPYLLEVSLNSNGASTGNNSWLSSNVSTISSLNLTVGSYDISLWCVDSLGNQGVLTLHNLIFLSESPGLSLSFSGGNHVLSSANHYISQGTNLVTGLTSNGHQNVSISLSIQSTLYLAEYVYDNSTTFLCQI